MDSSFITGPVYCSGIVKSVYDTHSIDSCINYHHTTHTKPGGSEISSPTWKDD